MKYANACLLSSALQGPNALVTYTIISGADDSFRIDPESGDLMATKKLDRERRSKYSLLVRADDGRQSSDMRLNITVKDVNDHTPKFSRLTYSFDIPEDTTPGKASTSKLGNLDSHVLSPPRASNSDLGKFCSIVNGFLISHSYIDI